MRREQAERKAAFNLLHGSLWDSSDTGPLYDQLKWDTITGLMKAVVIANPFRWACQFIRKEGGASLLEKGIIHTHSIDAEIPQVGGERSIEGNLSIRAVQPEGGARLTVVGQPLIVCSSSTKNKGFFGFKRKYLTFWTLHLTLCSRRLL